MTAVQPIDPSEMVSDQLAVASPDLLRDMMSTFIQALMSAEADAVCGAGYGERSDRDGMRFAGERGCFPRSPCRCGSTNPGSRRQPAEVMAVLS